MKLPVVRRRIDEKGFALVYTAVILTGLLLLVGLAVDAGRAYIVKAQLSTAVDGAALGAARMLNSGNPRNEAARLFQQNFPAGYMGTTAVTDAVNDPSFYSMHTVRETGVNVVRVRAQATVPTTFMRLGKKTNVVVVSEGEAQRRMVDLSLVLDVSSSIGSRWGAVRDAARAFVDAFDATGDRLSLITYSNGANVLRQMPAGRGFDKAGLKAAIPNSLPGGSTAMVEGLYRGWDELRTVPNGQQSGLRVIVLFTDGASNSVPGNWDGTGTAKGLRTYDFPERHDPDDQTHDNPHIAGLFLTNTGAASPNFSQAFAWNCRTPVNNCTRAEARYMVANSFHQHRRSSGIPTSFPLQTNALTVNGVPQSTRRGLLDFQAAANKYPAHVININNAARNLVEIIADAARDDEGGDYPIRIYTIGMGELVRLNLGSLAETSESILKRIANDMSSPDYNEAQLEGKYYFAQTGADVGPAFQALQSQIIRLTK